MATSALPAPTAPTLHSTGINAGVIGVSGTPAGMTVAVAGAGNGKTFANNGGRTLLLVYNKHATLAKTITPLVPDAKTLGGVAPTEATRSIGSGELHVFRFNADYEDTDGTVTVEAESTDIYFLAVVAS